MSEELLEGDPNSRIVDGLPDLSKYLFIHSSIDDAGLDPYEFRIFCHLRRRARDGTAYPGMRSISEVTGISLGKVCGVINSLQKKGFVTVKSLGPGLQNIYFIGLPAERAGVHVEERTVLGLNGGVHRENERYSIEGTPIKDLRSSHRAPLSEKNSEKPPNPLLGGNGAFSALPKKKKIKLTVESVLEAVKADLTLQSPLFAAAWKRWVENRLALPRPVTMQAFALHMAKCAVLGERRAIDQINEAIEHSWQTIYRPKNQPQNRRSETCL